eukprot:COSAG05_NODE_97_length_19444_cov_8.577174_12_plen_182_part_00
MVVQWINLVLLCFCTLEVIIKFIGFGAKHFMSDGWLISDLALVTITWALTFGGVKSGVQTLRVLRIFRMIVLASKMPTLVALIETLVKCLKASAALILITFLIVYLYSIIGMNMFGLLPSDETLRAAGIAEDRWAALRRDGKIFGEVCPECESFNDYSNFSNFLQAFQVLFPQPHVPTVSP